MRNTVSGLSFKPASTASQGVFLQADRPAFFVEIADLYNAGLDSSSASMDLSIASGLAEAAKSTTLTRAPGCSRLYDFVNPQTAPPIGDSAPCSSYPNRPPNLVAESRNGAFPAHA